MASKITLKELASILGVSISTISKALNDSHEISDATKSALWSWQNYTTTDPIKLLWD